MKFDNKVVLITGSSRGLGRQIALDFAKKNAKVVINYNNSSDKAIALSKELRRTFNDSIAIKADVGNEEEVNNMFDQIISRFGRIDILVNNAAIYEDSTVWNMDKEVWNKVISIGLTGVFNCTKMATKYMRKNGFGRIINISSVVGLIGVFGTSNYSAAKSGVFGLTKTVAKEVATKNITVNALTLGYFDEGMMTRLPKKIQDDIIERIPMKRLGKPEEVSYAVMFLSSDQSAYITGQIINLNGGFYM
mgnify:CR=1 FL=1